MLKRLILLFLVILTGCSNPPAPKEINVKTAAPAKSKAPITKPPPNPWTVHSFASKEEQSEERKYVSFVVDGNFSDSTRNNSYMYAEILVNKKNAGIFLHELKKTSPAEKFSGPVHIKMTNSEGQELLMNSSRRWNSNGGIMIESKNNDYSRFRIFLMQSKGTITAEVKASETKIYNFSINAYGFTDSFTRL